MAKKYVDCEHCKGKKNCTASGGRSCQVCMQAAGHGRKGWAAVRCSYCGGRGKVFVEIEEEEQAPAEEPAATEDKPEEEATE